MRYDWPNMLTEAMIVTLVTNSSTGRRPGSVTLRKRCMAFAPSIFAASYSSGEMSYNAAR